MAVIVTVKALHILFSREKHVEVVLMIIVGNVFQYLNFLHNYVSIPLHTVQLSHLPLYLFLKHFIFSSFLVIQ